eukprot:g9870.t1
MSTLDARVHAAEMLFAVKDYVAARRRSSDTTAPPDTRNNADWAKRDRAGWLALIHWAKHPDTSLPDTLLNGVKTIGNSDQSGVWALDPSVRPISQEEVDDYVTAKYVIRQAEPTGWDLRRLEGLREEIIKMIKLGLCVEVTNPEDIKTPPAPAFPKDEILKIRQVIDCRDQNMHSRLLEKMTIRGTRTIQEIFDLCHAPPGMEQEDLRPPSSASTKETWREASETVARAAEQANLRDEHLPRAQRRTLIKEVKQLSSRLQRYANMAKVPIWELLSRDFSKYYYLFGVDDPAKNNIEFWDPHDHRWRVVQSLVLSVGNSHSVPGACRVSEAMRSIYAHAGGICNLYIDDGFIFAPDPEAMEACRECYDTLAGALGLPLSPKDDGNQCSCAIMQDGGARDFVRGLGVRYVYDRASNCIYARVPPDVIKKCQEKTIIILQQLEAGCLKRKTVQQAIGVANYIICHTTRAGAEFLRAAYPWTSEEEFPARVRSRELRSTFQRTLRTLCELLPKLPPVRILFRVQRTNFIWLDASTNGAGLCTVTHEGKKEEVGKPMIGGIMITSEGVVKSFAIEMNPQHTTPAGSSRILNIQVLESLAAAFAQRIWRRDMRDAMNRVGVDNMCELYAFVKLSTRNNSVASIATYVAAESLNIGGRNLWSYTNTKLNPADAFCRRELLRAALEFWKPQDHYGTRSPGFGVWSRRAGRLELGLGIVVICVAAGTVVFKGSAGVRTFSCRAVFAEKGKGSKEKGQAKGGGKDEHKGKGQDEHKGKGQEEHKGKGKDEHKGKGHDEHKGMGHDDHKGKGKDEHKGKADGKGKEKGKHDASVTGAAGAQGKGKSKDKAKGPAGLHYREPVTGSSSNASDDNAPSPLDLDSEENLQTTSDSAEEWAPQGTDFSRLPPAKSSMRIDERELGEVVSEEEEGSGPPSEPASGRIGGSVDPATGLPIGRIDVDRAVVTSGSSRANTKVFTTSSSSSSNGFARGHGSAHLGANKGDEENKDKSAPRGELPDHVREHSMALQSPGAPVLGRKVFVSHENFALSLVADDPRFLNSEYGLYYQNAMLCCHAFSTLDGILQSSRVGLLVLSGVDQMPFNPNYALPQVATTALRFFMVELLLHVAYITEYVFYLKAAADNPTAKFSAREEFFDFTRLLDLFMIVGFFGTFAKVMLLDEPEDWPRVPRIDAMGEDTREPEDGFHAFFATTATHVFLALHIVHFVSAGFFRGSRRFYHGHGSIFTVFEGAVVLTLFTLCVCGGLWWYGERTMGGRFDSIPSGMLYALLYLVGEWLTADFRSNLGVILCVVQCLVGLVFFGILVGVVQDMLQDLLEHYVKYRDDQDWSHTRQYWLDREKMARGLELDANIKRRYSYLDDLREAVAAEKRGYLGAFGLGDPEGIEEKGKEGTSNDEADIYDEYWYGGHWDWKGYYGDEQWKFLDWRDGWDGQEEEEDADELDIKDVTDETEDDAARRKTTTLDPPTSDVVQVQGPLRSSLSLPPLPEEGPADEEESDEDHKSSNDKSKSSSSSAGDDDSEELPPAHPDLQEPPPPHPDEVPLPHPSVQEPTPSESASDEPTTSESQKEPQAEIVASVGICRRARPWIRVAVLGLQWSLGSGGRGAGGGQWI